MTNLAQLHDCHSCYDERSIDQKKLVLTLTFTLAFMATLVLALILAFLSPFGGSIFTFLGCNGEKRSLLSQGGGITFGAFGWAFARADSGLRRRFTFHWSLLKSGILCEEGGVEEDGAPCGGGWLSQ